MSAARAGMLLSSLSWPLVFMKSECLLLGGLPHLRFTSCSRETQLMLQSQIEANEQNLSHAHKRAPLDAFTVDSAGQSGGAGTCRPDRNQCKPNLKKPIDQMDLILLILRAKLTSL